MRRLTRLATVLAVGSLLVGCSSGNGSTDAGDRPTGGASGEDYFVAFETLAQETSAAFEELGKDITEALEGVTSEDEALEALRPGLEQAATLSQSALEELEGLSPPDVAADAHAAFVQSTREGTDLLVRLVEDYDGLTLEEIMVTLQGGEFAAAEEAQDRACVDLQAIADDQGADVDLECGDDGPTPASEPSAEPATPVADVERYENAEYGFSVEYPSTWALDERPRAALAQFSAFDDTGNTIAAGVNVTVEELPFELTPRQYMNIGWKKHLKPQLSQVEEIGRADLEIGKLPASAMEFRGRFEGSPSVGHYYQVAVLDGRTVFVWTYFANDEGFETYRAEAEAIIGSFVRA